MSIFLSELRLNLMNLCRCQNFLFVSVVRHVTRLVFDGWLPYRLC